jgi:serine/threonine-protein kinase RsbT
VTTAQDRVLTVLGRHLSATNAQNVLSRALRDSRSTAALLTPDDIQRIQPALERGLRLFLPLGTVANVLVELSRAFAPSEPPRAQTLQVITEADVSVARLAARSMCEVMGARRVVVQKVATVVSELARNMFMYAGGGQVELVPGPGPGPRLIIKATDQGPGIPHLDDVMGGKYKSKTGLGAGIVGTKRLVDRFEIATGPTGTRIEVEVAL